MSVQLFFFLQRRQHWSTRKYLPGIREILVIKSARRVTELSVTPHRKSAWLGFNMIDILWK